MNYRAELDGMRAIAVLSVALYHGGLTFMPGGYVGVDIFFVLSGFLITSIIYRQINSGSFTFSDFYWRRFRRILPALFFMIIVVAGVCYKYIDPILFKDFGASVWTTALFSSNIYFWTEAGYFQKAAELKPLLHTWSLGVEEQYYIFFPFLMIFIKKWTSDRFILLLSLVGGASLLLSIYGVYAKPIATFYLLPTRLWELLLGSLLAVSALPTLKKQRIVNLVSWAGMAMILIPVFLYSRDTPFPGLAAIPPCLGAALVIWSLKGQERTSLKKILSWSPVVFIGKVSYSFYLWHWPVLILCNYYTFEDLTVSQSLLALFVAFLISCFSWAVVEKPFRENHVLFPKIRMLNISFATIGLVTILGIGIFRQEGMPSRFDMDLRKIVEAENNRSIYFNDRCWDLKRENAPQEFCIMGEEILTRPTFILWGDSHAGAIAPVFDKVAKELNASGSLAFWNGCPPLLHVQRKYKGQRGNCLRDRVLIKEYISKNPDINTVILAARWAFYTEDKPIRPDKSEKIFNIEYNGDIVENYQLMVRESLEDTVSWLRNEKKNVVIIMDVPEYSYNVPQMLTKLAIRNSDMDIRMTVESYKNRLGIFFEIASDIAQKYNVKFVYPHKYLCGELYCNILIQDTPLYVDQSHLSVFGAMQLQEMARKVLSPSP